MPLFEQWNDAVIVEMLSQIDELTVEVKALRGELNLLREVLSKRPPLTLTLQEALDEAEVRIIELEMERSEREEKE